MGDVTYKRSLFHYSINILQNWFFFIQTFSGKRWDLNLSLQQWVGVFTSNKQIAFLKIKIEINFEKNFKIPAKKVGSPMNIWTSGAGGGRSHIFEVCYPNFILSTISK